MDQDLASEADSTSGAQLLLTALWNSVNSGSAMRQGMNS